MSKHIHLSALIISIYMSVYDMHIFHFVLENVSNTLNKCNINTVVMCDYVTVIICYYLEEDGQFCKCNSIFPNWPEEQGIAL